MLSSVMVKVLILLSKQSVLANDMRIEYSGFADTLTFDRITSLSAATAALCISGLNILSKRYVWQLNGGYVDDATWDEIDKLVGEAMAEVMSEIVGFMFPAMMNSFDGVRVLICDGSTYSREDYPLLYDRTHSSLIVDANNFKVPDMRGYFPLGRSDGEQINDTGGEREHALTLPEMPEHDHSWSQYTFGIDIESVGVPDPTGVGQPEIPRTTGSAGGGQPHNNMPPYVVVDWMIVAG